MPRVLLLFVFWFWLLVAVAFINLATALVSFRRKSLPALKKYPSVTIICRTWDDDHIVDRFIKGCLAQDYKGKLEIIIADDASQDRTPEVVKKYKGKIIYVRAKKHHKWKAMFLNPIIKKHVKSEILINMDIDAVMPRDYVTKMVRSLQMYDAVSSACIGGNPWTMIAKIRIIEDIWAYCTGMAGREVLIKKSGIYGGSHAIWMKVLREVGYYGTKTMVEDAELTVMLNERGYRTGFCDDVVVLLEDVETLKHYLNERKRWVYGPMEVAKAYNGFQLYNLIFLINILLSTTSLVSLVLSFFDPIFAIPLGMNLLTHILSLKRFRAEPRVYSWILLYIFLDPVLEALALLGILKDSVFGKGVKWVKVSGNKYHMGDDLVPVFRRQ